MKQHLVDGLDKHHKLIITACGLKFRYDLYPDKVYGAREFTFWPHTLNAPNACKNCKATRAYKAHRERFPHHFREEPA